MRVAGGDRLLDLGKKVAGRRRIELHVFLEIEPAVVGIDPVGIGDRSGVARRVLREEGGAASADELRRPLKHPLPKRGVEDGIVDIADDVRLHVAAIRFSTKTLAEANRLATARCDLIAAGCGLLIEAVVAAPTEA